MTDATTVGRKGFQSTLIHSIQGSRIPREGGHVRKDKTPLNAVTDETVALIIPEPEPELQALSLKGTSSTLLVINP